MTAKPLAVSLVIPAYNEAGYLAACLDAVAAQTVPPQAVIVVDNNSSDQTVAIARHYPFVTLLSEPRQGILYARDAGFNAVKAGIIGRIDADTRLPKDWVENVARYFADHPDVAAVSSENTFYDAPLKRLLLASHWLAYFAVQRVIAGAGVLWGSNMAIRRDHWRQVSAEAVHPGVHEDIDLMLKLKKNHLKAGYAASLRGQVSLRRGNFNPLHTLLYLSGGPRTYFLNGYYARGCLFALELALVYLVTLPFALLSMLFGR